MEILLESFGQEWEALVRLLPRLVIALVVFIVTIFISKFISKGIMKLLARGKFNLIHQNFFRGITRWVMMIIGLIIALNILGLKSLATSLVAGGGITAVVLGFAFREIGENLLAGFFLAFSRPFEIGSLIQSGEFQGIVKNIELRSTHIRAADGRDIFIPSSEIFSKPIINFTKDGLRRLSFKIGIDYSDNSENVRMLLLETVKGVENILIDPKPGVMFSAFQAQYVELEVFFWIDMFDRQVELGKIRNEAFEKCRRAIMENNITVSANVSNNLSLSSAKTLELSISKV
ncbi:MAG: hypothetical protein DWP97_13405 [Calditrichaeota bacterium]|nr:MAG: hypothetical protein DWP97_13405 [Calditrichota bacterium]